MRVIWSTLLGTTLLASCASGVGGQSGIYSAYVPPKEGSLLTYMAYADGEADMEVKQLVVATGADYTLYANISEYGDPPQQEDYFIEYSGLYWHVCGDMAPSSAERRALQQMWPISENDSTIVEGTSLTETNVPTEVKIVSVGEFDSEEFGLQPIFKVRSSFDTPETTVFAPQMSVAMRIDWGDWGSENYAGNDQLKSISEDAEGQYNRYLDYGKSQCLPAELR
ncbi:hypothetical protein [Hirschia litorea]|uniref:Lipoprotein n=1 Tax=Hirschia litorea TaxID=1199156 RepID=A0ABW2IGV3_9PROT